MPDRPPGQHQHHPGEIVSLGFSVKPPPGFTAELYPLRHKFAYSAGLSVITGTMNSTMFTLVRNYKAANDPDTIFVNPHHGSFETETGSVCAEMSIIDKLSLSLRFNFTELSDVDNLVAIRGWWQPIFFSFGEKLDSVDLKSTDTAAAVLNLTKDATQEDITPAFGNKLPVLGLSHLSHPVSTANLTEATTHLNLTTDLTMEAVPHDDDLLMKALRYYTNKGAISSLLGRRRFFTVSKQMPHKSFFVKKFVPRSIRRIVPYTYFGLLIHVPLESEPEQFYYDATGTASKANVGVKALITYDEWNSDHSQLVD